MSSRRGIFFNSKSRTTDKIDQLATQISSEIPIPSTVSTTINVTNQTTATSTPSTGATTATVKKKIILNHAKRALTKNIYSGPRKIFSTNYKVIWPIRSICLFRSNYRYSRQIEHNWITKHFSVEILMNTIWTVMKRKRRPRFQQDQLFQSVKRKLNRNRLENFDQLVFFLLIYWIDADNRINDSTTDYMCRTRWNTKLHWRNRIPIDWISTWKTTQRSLSKVNINLESNFSDNVSL